MKLGPGSLDTIVLTMKISHLVRHDTIHTSILAHSKFMHEYVCNTYCVHQYISDMRCPTHVVDTIGLWLTCPTCTVVTTNVSNICCAIRNKQYYGHTKHRKYDSVLSHRVRCVSSIRKNKHVESKIHSPAGHRSHPTTNGGGIKQTPGFRRRRFRGIP